MSWSGWQSGSQAQGRAKRPLTYDVIDYWRSIGGTRLSDDGQWLAYALTSQAEDGELIVRNSKSGQEFKHARGTAPQFTPDGKFVVFTIVPPKADDERNDAAAERRGRRRQPAGRGRRRGGAGARRQPRATRSAS